MNMRGKKGYTKQPEKNFNKMIGLCLISNNCEHKNGLNFLVKTFSSAK